MIRIKPSWVNGLIMSRSAHPWRKKDYCHRLHLSVTVYKSITKNPSRINKFLVVILCLWWICYADLWTLCMRICDRMNANYSVCGFVTIDGCMCRFVTIYVMQVLLHMLCMLPIVNWVKNSKNLKKQQKSQVCQGLALGKAGHCVAVVPSFAECRAPGSRQRNFQKINKYSLPRASLEGTRQRFFPNKQINNLCREPASKALGKDFFLKKINNLCRAPAMVALGKDSLCRLRLCRASTCDDTTHHQVSRFSDFVWILYNFNPLFAHVTRHVTSARWSRFHVRSWIQPNTMNIIF